MATDSKSGMIVAFIIGIGVGAAVTLLAGDELRGDIIEAISDGVNQVREKTKDLRNHSQKFVKAAKEQVQDAVEHGTDAFKQAKKAGA